MLVLGAAGGRRASRGADRQGARRWVAGTSSVEKHDFLRGLGVDEPLDKNGAARASRSTSSRRRSAGTGRAVPALRDGGLVVTSPASSVARAAARRARTRPGSSSSRTGSGLEGLAALGLKPHVDATFPLEEAARAHELGEQGRTRGKIVLTI